MDDTANARTSARWLAAIGLTIALLPSANADEAAPREGERTLPEVLVTASRLGDGLVGASTTVITAEDIARSPGATLQEILARQPGIQIQTLYGGANGVRDVVDMRGFGAAAASNTLVLVNGRRLNDIDLAGVDFSAIPRDSIERIEILRGNGGAVLYGDGAAGGVINIVTKTGFRAPTAYRAEAGIGSFGHREANTAIRQTVDDVTVSIHGNLIDADGYRRNNEVRQRNIIGEARHFGEKGDVYVNLSADDQTVGLPGGRRVTLNSNQLTGNRRGTGTPFDFADKQGLNGTVGMTRVLADGVKLIVDAGVRHKTQQSAFFSSSGASFDTYSDTQLTTLSATPRVDWRHDLFGMPATMLAGFDGYQSGYDSDRKNHAFDTPIHVYDLRQRSLAGYFQETVALTPRTEVSLGGRLQRIDLSARDRLNRSAPGGSNEVQGRPLDDDDTEYALHLGAEHWLTEELALFGRIGRSMRFPNVDERVGSTPFGVPTNFALKSQTSRDVEAGFKVNRGGLEVVTSAYVMELENELHYQPATFTNINLDATRRWGVETAADYRFAPDLRLKGALAFTDAEFRAGRYKDNRVPLVSDWTGSAGIAWDIWKRYAMLDVDARYAGRRRFDNDQRNFQPQIPAQATVDLRLAGELEWMEWSFAVRNLFDADYYDYGIASATTPGTYDAYPLPGRTFLFKLGARF